MFKFYIYSKKNSNLDFNVCISDNGSNYNVKQVTDNFKDKLDIILNINKKNLGYQPNLLKAISLSQSEFVWAIGDDDLLMPNSLSSLNFLFNKFKDVDFLCEFLPFELRLFEKISKTFDTNLLPKNMSKLAKKKLL